MTNQVILIGRLAEELKIEENENGIKECKIKVAVSRNYKNPDGIYETDFIPCILFNGIAQNTCEYCKKGDLIAIKGRICSKDSNINIIAEKITFLSSRKEEK